MQPPNLKSWLLAAALLLLQPPSASAAVIGYWRMEADLDPDVNLLEVANEVAFGSSLTSIEAFVDTAANPNFTVPLTGEDNDGSLGGTMQGAPNGINATAAWYAELDVSSITIEFWARTVENQATLFSRSSGNNGITIANPSSLDVTYWVEDGAGGATQVQLLNIYDMDSTWRHFAFTYDEISGIGNFWVDGVAVGSHNGADNRALVWGTNVPLQLGQQMDYAAAFNGTLDEVRIMDEVAGSAAPTLAPEPTAAAFALAGMAGVYAVGRRRS